MPLDEQDLLARTAPGEDSTRQFKSDIRNAEALAAEMAAFANTDGGVIFIGVSDSGEAQGLSRPDVARVNQLISNAASQHVRSPLIVHTENVLLRNGRVVIVLTVPKGLDKPYFDKNGVIWLKVGSDKRRVNSKEELRRFFQMSSQFHADELPTKADVGKIDKLFFRDFLQKEYGLDFPTNREEVFQLLKNLNLATSNFCLNLAGVLLFAEQTDLIVPEFAVKAVSFPGNTIYENIYIDTEDFYGPMTRVFKASFAFIMRNLHKIQAGNSVNAPGTPEIPGIVFEELLVNALIHRDYLVNAPTKIFVFDNRIEIISPGHLPNNLTVENIKVGISSIRNPILVSYASKGLLPYHGIGSGIGRAMNAWPYIDFIDDSEGCVFKAIVHRQDSSVPIVSENSPKISPKNLSLHGIDANLSDIAPKISPKNPLAPEIGASLPDGAPEMASEKSAASLEASPGTNFIIMKLIRANTRITTRELGEILGISRRTALNRIAELKNQGKLRHVGPPRGGYWEIVE